MKLFTSKNLFKEDKENNKIKHRNSVTKHMLSIKEYSQMALKKNPMNSSKDIKMVKKFTKLNSDVNLSLTKEEEFKKKSNKNLRHDELDKSFVKKHSYNSNMHIPRITINTKSQENDTNDVHLVVKGIEETITNYTNQNWVSAPTEIKEEIKTNLMKALVKFNDKFMKKKIIDIIGILYQSISKNEEKWEQVLQYIVEGFKLPLNKENDFIIASAVLLLSKIFRFAMKELTPGIDVFISGFDKYFQEGSIDLQTTSTETICEILSENLGKENTKKFKNLIFYILKTVLKCLEANDINNLKISLFALSNLAQFQPAMLKKNFRDITILMSKIIENKNLEDDQNLREVAFEVLVSIIESHPKVITDDKDQLKGLINSIYKEKMKMKMKNEM